MGTLVTKFQRGMHDPLTALSALPTLALAALLCLTPATRSAHALTAGQDPGPSAADLVFTPESPPPGSTVTVTYHPAETLAGEPELIPRGHFRIANGTASGLGVRNERIATLTPGNGGSFGGSFRLPDLASHGVFVVEDIAGERLDTNGGRHFDLLVHGEDKSSLADALFRRAGYFEDRDPAVARESLERAMELRREALAEQHPGDSVTVTFTGSSVMLTGEDLERMELPPGMRWTRIWRRWQENGDSRTALDEFEAEWPAISDKRTSMSNSALLIAVRTRDLAAVDRWAGRILDNGWTDPWSDKLMVARMISQIPGRRARALELAAGAMADLDAVDSARDPGRQLGQTAREYVGVIARARADALVKHYRLLAEAGFEEESLEVLEAATAESAEPELFRRPLPPVRVADAEGERFALEQIVGGEPAVVVFWARWCGPCIEEIPEVARLARSLEPQGVRLVSVSTDDVPGPEMDAWLLERSVTYPVFASRTRISKGCGGSWRALGLLVGAAGR